MEISSDISFLLKIEGVLYMDGRNRSNIKIGITVLVVEKQNQRSGEQTEGEVARILTNSKNHPHGIKVMLEDGTVGRVKEIIK